MDDYTRAICETGKRYKTLPMPEVGMVGVMDGDTPLLAHNLTEAEAQVIGLQLLKGASVLARHRLGREATND